MTDSILLPDRVAALVALLRADPEAAVEATRQMKVLQTADRSRNAHERSDASGRLVLYVKDERNGWFGNLPTGRQLRIDVGESVDSFIARVETAWVADGWILL